MQFSRKIILLIAMATLFVGAGVAQYRRGGGRGFGGGDSGPLVSTEGGVPVNEDTVRTARETAPHSSETPNWTNAPGFEKDVFTFTRTIFKSAAGSRGWRAAWIGWLNDYPDSDLNLSYRLQQSTSMKVDPDGRVVRLTESALYDYPFIFMAKPGNIDLRDDEISCLRKYLLNGGVLMADDFWSTREWENFAAQMKSVLPDRDWVDLPIEHPLFHCVFDLKGPMNQLQVPSIHHWRRDYDPNDSQSSPSNYRGEGSEEMHLRAWLDDKKRIMVVANFNTDFGDGWEREAENPYFFQQFSESRAYPFAINIIFYLMTH